MSASSKENLGKKPFSKKSGFTKYRKSNYGHRPYYRSGNHIASFKKNNSLSQLSTSNPYSSKNVVGDTNPKEGPYFGWKLYFPGECYEENSIMDNKLRSIIKYFLKNGNSFKMEDIESMHYFIVDAKSVSTDTDLQSNWPDLIADLRNLPEQVINYFGLSMHQIISIEREKTIVKILISSGLDSSSDNIVPMIHARFVNYEPVLPLKNLKSNAYGKFISVKGTVVRVSNIKPLCLKLAFKCNFCNSTQVIIQPQGRYCVPSKCPTKNCSSHNFQPLQSSSFTETVDSQNIRLQETMVDGEREGGRVPRTVECELMEDLVNTCMPGDIVTLSGIVKINSTGEGKASSNKDKCMYLLYISTNSITSLKQNVQSCSAISAGFDFNLKDLYAVQAIEAEKHLFRLIVSSICPSIYGHEMVKAGLVLGLFGGRHKFHEEENHIPVRGDPHILIVGDPGLGKSQMLQSCSNIAPRGVYVCGNTTTSSGLTVTLSKETGGEYALEAGALVLADQGCCCIDEFDKMNSQHHALLEAMEQQTISIAKGGIVCSLPARTSILAAANPVGGHYNKAKTVSENLKLGSALLSRFDLVFIMLDKPDEELDCKLSEHIMSMHSGKNPLKLVVKGQKNDLSASVFQASFQPCGNDLTIKEKLKFKADEECDHIPHQLLRKYIAYARKYVHPQLSPEAAHVLQQFYLDLRKHHQSSNSTPITTRQLESLIRLTEARARLELRENCTADDAQDVVDIMKYSMCDTYADEYGLLDFQRSLNGSGTSFRSRSKKFISALTKVAERMGNKLFSVQHMKQIARDVGIEIIGFEEFISSLNNQGFLIKKGPKLYHLQTI